ncbi:MAG TPA: NINE protein [Verrucomicrobiae bacterium]|jgi:TM2 domain-containing membrane protein YozV|nr:NINE protein [Verrucomicrobiae bacterium]
MDQISTSLALKSQLSSQQLALFESEMNKRRKSVALAYILLILLGGLGIHRFYLGYNSLAIAMLVCFIVGVFTAVIFIGILPLAFCGVMALVDLFLTPGLTDRANEHIERQVLAQLPVGIYA